MFKTVFKTAKADQISDLFDSVSSLNLVLKIQTIHKKLAKLKLKIKYAHIGASKLKEENKYQAESKIAVKQRIKNIFLNTRNEENIVLFRG